MSQNNKQIVVIEDNKINARLFVDLLELNGMRAHSILNGRLAFDYIVNNPVDLIIMDIQLQDILGIDIIKQIKNTDKISTIPIIAVTAFASQQDEQKIMEAGCDAYVPKPISIDHFIGVVNKFLNKELC